MSELPSIYSSSGLSQSERKKVLTVGKQRQQRSIGAIKIESKVNDIIGHNNNGSDKLDQDGDIPMLGMDDENEVQLVADYVLDKRNAEPMGVDAIMATDLIPKYYERDLTPEEKLSKDTILVIDTNFIISHLSIIDELAKLHKKFHHKIVIPVTVIRELDGLKLSKRKTEDSISGQTIGNLARWANDWIYRKFGDRDSAVQGQKIRECIDKNAIKDDSILDCCLYFHQKNNALVILLSNDKNLCMKALSNDILTVSYRKGMSADMIARISFVENKSSEDGFQQVQEKREEPPQQQFESGDNRQLYYDEDEMLVEHSFDYDSPTDHETKEQKTMISGQREEPDKNSHLITIDDFYDAATLIHNEVQILVLSAIDYCMFNEYEDDLELVGYDKSEIITLKDCSLTMIRFWMSVFTEYFSERRFKPFYGRGKKMTQFTDVPRSIEELQKFVDYWTGVLRALYVKRDESQNSALEKIIERWEHITDNF